MLHALLRLALLCVNVLDTFKIVKAPKVRKGQTAPSVRALLARKRDMKGMMCVWIVSICWIYLERICDRTVVYLMPFYGQIKIMCLLFLLLTRASGAEPIVLNFLRPAIKPYTKTIDGILELLSMVFAFTTELAAGPLQAVKERWQTFSNAASELQATTRAGSEAVERDHAGGYQRQRRFSVFSFWKDDGDGPLDALDQAANEEDPNDAEAPEEDVIRDRDQDDAMVQRGETTVAHYQRTVSDSKSQVDKPLPPAPAAAYVSSSGSSGPRLGNVSTALPVYERYPSQRSQKAQVEQVGGASGGLLGLVDMDQARNVVRQANEVYDGIDEAQEDVRKRLARTRNRQGPVRIDQLPGGGPLTRPVGHHVASSSSGSRMHEDGNHTTSSPPPQPPLQRSPPGTTYVPAPPAEHLGQSEYGENSSWGYQRYPSADSRTPVRLPGHMSPPILTSDPRRTTAQPVSYGAAMSMLPPQASTHSNPLANIDVEPYFHPANSAVHMSDRGRRRPPPLHSASAQSIPDDDDEALQQEQEIALTSDFRPSTPPSQYLGPQPQPLSQPRHDAYATMQEEEARFGPVFLGPALPPPETPMAPGGFGRWDDGDSDREEDEDDGEVGPDDSISVRGMQRLMPSRDTFFARNQHQPPPIPGPEKFVGPLGRPRKAFTLRGADTRPTTLNDFEQMRMDVEAEEAAAAAAGGGEGQTGWGETGGGGSGTRTPKQRREKSRLSNYLPGHFPMTPGFPPSEGTPEADGDDGDQIDVNDTLAGQEVQLSSPGYHADPGRELGSRRKQSTTFVQREPDSPTTNLTSGSEVTRLKKVIEEALGGKGPIQLPAQQFSAPVLRQRPSTTSNGDPSAAELRRPRPKALHVLPSPAIPGPPTGGTGASRSKRNLQTIEESVSISLGASLRGGRGPRAEEEEEVSIPPADSSRRAKTSQGPGSSSTGVLFTRGGRTVPQPSKSTLEQGPAATASGVGSRGKVTRSRPTISQKRSSSDMGRDDENPAADNEVPEHAATGSDATKKKRRVASGSEPPKESASAVRTRSSGRNLRARAGHDAASASSSSASGAPPHASALPQPRHLRTTSDRMPNGGVDEVGALPRTRRRNANATQ